MESRGIGGLPLFFPADERVAKTDLLVVTSEVHQISGRYMDHLRTNDGASIQSDGLIGFAEEHQLVGGRGTVRQAVPRRQS